jgi:hypothetical protein
MSEVPEFLFLVTSTALVLGAAITIRGLLGFRPVPATDALPAPVFGEDPTDALLAQASGSGVGAELGAGVPASDEAPTSPPQPVVRDLREPIVMTIAGILICTFTVLGIAALVNNTY